MPHQDRTREDAETLIIGAGVSGLSCARELAAAGRAPLILEKSRGVGGRCATRRVEGQPVDHGPAFLHGSDPGFLSAIDAVGAERTLDGWPHRVHGRGRPCLPRAFSGSDRRVGFADGVKAFPESLANGSRIRFESRLVRLRRGANGWEARDDRDREYRAGAVVLTLPVPQTLELLRELGDDSGELGAIRYLLSTMSAFPCLTLLAGYPPEAGPPSWDLCLPEDSRILQSISFDSAKRARPAFTVLVCQALPGWSRQNAERPREEWAAEMLRETGFLAGDWAARPLWHQAHRWRFARAGTGNELTRPLLARLDGGLRLGIAGEVCAPGGGVEAAWRSGREMARRLLEE